MQDFLSQEEIDFLVNNSFVDSDKDVIGEIGNMAMGVSSTTLSNMLGGIKVTITTPKVDIIKYKDLMLKTKSDNLAIKIDYTKGIEGCNLLIVSKDDANVIANLMLQNKDKFIDYDEETLKSAIGEAMNQMMASSAGTIGKIINSPVNISTPEVEFYSQSSDSLPYSSIITSDTDIVSINFMLEVQDYIKSSIMLIFDISSANSIVKMVKKTQEKVISRIDDEVYNSIKVYFESISSIFGQTLGMLGFNSSVELSSVELVNSIQYIDINIIKSPSVINTNTSDGYCFCYSFGEDLMKELKSKIGYSSFQELTEILKEVNNQFTNTIINSFFNSKLSFDKDDYEEYLKIDNNQYILATFSLENKKFYILCNEFLFEKNRENKNINKENASQDKNINLKDNLEKNIEKPLKEPYNTEIVEKTETKSVFNRIPLRVSVVIDKIEITLKDLLFLNNKSMIPLSKRADDCLDIYINNIKKGKGEIKQVSVNKINYYAVEIKKLGD